MVAFRCEYSGTDFSSGQGSVAHPATRGAGLCAFPGRSAAARGPPGSRIHLGTHGCICGSQVERAEDFQIWLLSCQPHGPSRFLDRGWPERCRKNLARQSPSFPAPAAWSALSESRPACAGEAACVRAGGFSRRDSGRVGRRKMRLAWHIVYLMVEA